MRPLPSYDVDEVKKHVTEDDCWVIIHDKVYNISGWLKKHPGGSKIILTHAGLDATDMFTCFHSPVGWDMLAQFHVGNLTEKTKVPPVVEDYRRLVMSARRRGLFKPAVRIYCLQIALLMGILTASLSLLYIAAPTSNLGLLAGGALMGLFFQHAGGMLHDFMHHSFTPRKWSPWAIWFISNICQGLSGDGWAPMHNLHHASLNRAPAVGRPLDPEMETRPLLVYSPELLPPIPEVIRQYILPSQPYYLPFVLLIVRAVWYGWTVEHLTHLAQTKPFSFHMGREIAGLVFHWCWYLGTAFHALPAGRALAFLATSQAVGGFLVAFFAMQTHVGQDLHGTDLDIVTEAALSTYNAPRSVFYNWISGGLCYHIEHHLFPLVPRYKLHHLASEVEALLKKHDLPYEVIGLKTRLHRIFTRLTNVGKAARLLQTS